MMLFIVVTVSLVGFVDMARVCDNGWMAYNNYCYLFSTIPAQFKGAVIKCVNLGSDLIELSGGVEENWVILQSKIRGYREYWIGLTDFLVAENFVSASTGVKPSYTNWKKGQPDKGNREHCAGLYIPHIQWHDFYCNNKMHYICKKPANHYV